MFFKKSVSQKTEPLGRVALIGDSPLAFLLAYILQNNNFEVSFLTSLSKPAPQSVSLTLKTDSFQTKHFTVNYADSLPPSVDFCFVASSPESYKKDFLITQTSSLKETPILNFSHICNRRLFEDKEHQNIIPVYTNCWLNLEKNFLEMLGGKTVFEICCSLKNFSAYENLLKNPLVEVKNISNTKPCLWQHLIPFLLSNLLITAYKDDPLSSLKQKEVRQQITSSLKELCALAKNDKEEIKESDVFAFLYTIPHNYKSKFLSPKNFSVLESLLPQISYFDTPSLYKLFSLAKKS